jgi:hypothetical protein
MLWFDTFRIKEKKFKEFQDWAKANKDNLVKLGELAGWKFRGVYYFALGTGTMLGAHACFMWEVPNYAAIDKSLGTFKNPLDKKISMALNELLESGMPTPSLILKPFELATVYEGQ